MRPRRPELPGLFLAAALAAAPLLPAAGALDGRARALHVLNRLAFGPCPGQLKEVESIGPEAWIARQLQPDSIDDADCDARLAAFGDVKKSATQLYQDYPPPKKAKQMAMQESPSMADAPRADTAMMAQDADQMAKDANKRIRGMQDAWAAAKLTRLVYSRRQLQAVMADFWFNHFNVSEQKNQDKWLFGPYDRDVILPHALGRFSDLLLAVAKSPAMLVYLDNALSRADPRYVPEGQKEEMERVQATAPSQGKRQAQGLNENYARELMELHTLGVDSGYTQKDVIEAARILTGWSTQGPEPPKAPRRRGPAPAPPFTFVFRPRQHDRGPKTVLGQFFPAGGGEEEGERLLELLSRRPETAHFLALKLCRRFVCDDPPPALLERVAAAYLQSGTDISATLRAIFDSPEFWDPALARAKVKTPLEFVASSLRVTGAQIVDPPKILHALDGMGEPLYACEPPTGYPDTAEAWISSSALLSRMNFAMQLFDPRHSPARVEMGIFIPPHPSQDGRAELDALLGGLLQGEASDSTRAVLAARLKDPEISHRKLDDKRPDWQLGTLAALILGSPEFQRR
jgi:uncharacterized protein (DUF1800 family)